MFIPFLLTVIIQIIIPVFFSAWLWWTRGDPGMVWFSRLFLVISYTGYTFTAGGWFWVYYRLRYLMAGVVLTSVLAGLFWNWHNRVPLFQLSSWKSWVEPGFYAVLGIIFLILFFSAVRGSFYQGEALNLTFPLKGGTFYVAQGGSTKIINHHLISEPQQYGLDMVKLYPVGNRARGMYPRKLERYAVYGQEVYSPCDGLVTAAVDGLPDHIPPEADKINLAGNYVLLYKDGYKILLAHLQQSSVVVQAGDMVKEGQLLGRVGNSGNTSEPHLHIHVEKGGSKEEHLVGIGVPVVFDNKFLVRNSLVIK